jgi:2,3-bisphosphoglycerate-independent phosphoglycerate mutase
MGVDLGSDEVAYRCNLVTLSGDVPPTMVDFAAGHPTNEQSHPIVAALDDALGNGRDGVRFHPGVEYRHLCVVPQTWADADCTPPHDLTGRPAVFPAGAAASKLNTLMDASRAIVGDVAPRVGCAATQIWLWGQGMRPDLPSFTRTYGVTGRMSSAVDLVQGLGVLTGIDVVDVPGATAGFDNDYAAQARACLDSLADRDLFVLHVEATDEAGHQGRVDVKVDALERWDRDVIGPVVDALDERREAYRILLLPDHATPCARKTHTADAVPYLLYDSANVGAGGVYTEAATAADRPVAAHELMRRLLTP